MSLTSTPTKLNSTPSFATQEESFTIAGATS
jgi:hypothetical protein